MGKKKRLFYLDFVRAISVILIIIFHFDVHLGLHSIKSPLVLFQNYTNGNLGDIGVSLFLIISGASLMYTYEDNFKIKHFCWKRFISIYPIFWTAYSIFFLFIFYINKSIPHLQNKWTFLLTILGMDGYSSLALKIPTYYLVGEWFLGFIILFYVLFPLLRKLVIEKPKIFLICVGLTYFGLVYLYSYVFKIIDLNLNLFVRLPEYIFGMYFIRYIKKPNLYQFLFSLIAVTILLWVKFKIPNAFIITSMGICLFIVLAYVGNYVTNQKISNLIRFVSKYSFANILVHQLIIAQLSVRFNGLSLTRVESYCLFIINYILIMVVSFYVYRISDRFKNLLNEIKAILLTQFTDRQNKKLESKSI